MPGTHETCVPSHAIWTTEASESRGWFRFVGRSGGPDRPNYLNHLDVLVGDDFGLDRPETLVRDVAVVQICGTKPVMVQIESALGQVSRDGTTCPGFDETGHVGRRRCCPPRRFRTATQTDPKTVQGRKLLRTRCGPDRSLSIQQVE